jgi:hypothetical protein
MLKRIPALLVVAALAVGGASAPAIASAKTHAAKKPHVTTTVWTAARCTSWKAAALKRYHNKPTAAQLAYGNRVLTRHHCSTTL